MPITSVRGPEDVLRVVRDDRVQFISLWFTDILGFLKSFTITADELQGALEDGMGFDGSSIEGFARIEESDMMAKPCPDTFCILPWRPREDCAVARMFCDIVQPDGKPYDGDPRQCLKRILRKASEQGYTYYVGPELEYFYLKSSHGNPEFLDRGGYFDCIPLDMARSLRKETVLTLQSFQIPVEYSHHEVAPSQHEIDLRYTDALAMADRVMTYKLAVKEVALQHGVYATFMPKPFFGQNGSGMHTHQSLFKGDRNAFFDPGSQNHLTELALKYIAGLLRHAPEFTLVTNQWVNSYKRLVPGYEAPVYLTWALRNRSDLIRVPVYKPGKERATRVEFRSPDPACNPYLAFAVMLASGLKGINENYTPIPPTGRNVYEMCEKERQELKVETLPGSLQEAISLAEKSAFLQDVLGTHIFHKLIENKKAEWDDYRSRVTSWEIEKYLPVL